MLSAFATLAAVGAGALAFLFSGTYEIAATTPHLPPVRWAIATLKDHSVRRSARDIVAPRLDDAALVRTGFVLYDKLTSSDKRALAAAVKAVQEPLSQVASKVANA